MHTRCAYFQIVLTFYRRYRLFLLLTPRPPPALHTLSNLLHKVRQVVTTTAVRTLCACLLFLSYMRSRGLFCVASQNTRKIHRSSRGNFRFDNDNGTCYPKKRLLLFCHYTIFFDTKWRTSHRRFSRERNKTRSSPKSVNMRCRCDQHPHREALPYRV